MLCAILLFMTAPVAEVYFSGLSLILIFCFVWSEAALTRTESGHALLCCVSRSPKATANR